MKEGFVTEDMEYAAVPFGKKLMIIHRGQQVEVVNTVLQAHKFIKAHRKQNS
jgi:hypothetical protein